MCTVGKEKNCKIPSGNGYITRESDEKVLGLSKGLQIAEWEKKEEDRPDQTWEKSPFDTEHYFTLTNENTKKMLHGLRGSYQGNRLNNGQPNMPSKDLVNFSKNPLILTKIKLPQLPFGNLKTIDSQTKMAMT